ncbi:MAG: S8 family serine peptidase [Limnochordaceae bacterium]|nr:S8 family serine peptidase [Limnochordaceae bacterium]
MDQPSARPRPVRLLFSWRSWTILALLSVLSLVLAACGGGGSPTFTLSGYVRSANGATPIGGAQVAVPSVNTVATTNSNGWYQLVGLPRNSGNLSVVVTAANYEPVNQVITPPAGPSATQNFLLQPVNPGGSAGVAGTVTYTTDSWVMGASATRSWPPAASSTSMVRPTFAPPVSRPARHVTVELRPGASGVPFGSSDYVVQSMMEQVRDLLAGSGLPKLNYRVFPYMERLGRRLATIEVPAGMTAELLAQRLQSSNAVLRARPAQYVYPTSYPVRLPNDPSYSQQYQYNLLGMPQTWALQPDAGSERVAVIDTGVRFEHPDLRGNLLSGYDFVDNDSDPTDPGSDTTFSSHGTHVAGLISARTNNGFQVAGTAWYTSIIPFRSLQPSDRTPIEYTTEAIAAAASPQYHADVINLSLGVEGQPDPDTQQLFRDAINGAIAAGATVVAASGNDLSGQAPVSWPAAYQPVIAVGAIDQSKARAYFSNSGPELDVMAPGVNVLSTSWNKPANSYDPDRASGTSMATPIVSGIVALMRAAGLSPNQVSTVLAQTAMDIGQPGKDNETGYGVINPYLAVASASGAGPDQLWIGFVTPDGTPLSQAVHPSFTPTSQGNWSYSVTGVRAGSGFVFAWLDVNRDGQLDEGDYVGKYPQGSTPITIAAGQSISAPLTAGIFSGAGATAAGRSVDVQMVSQAQRLWEGLIKAIPAGKTRASAP